MRSFIHSFNDSFLWFLAHYLGCLWPFIDMAMIFTWSGRYILFMVYSQESWNTSQSCRHARCCQNLPARNTLGWKAAVRRNIWWRGPHKQSMWCTNWHKQSRTWVKRYGDDASVCIPPSKLTSNDDVGLQFVELRVASILCQRTYLLW